MKKQVQVLKYELSNPRYIMSCLSFQLKVHSTARLRFSTGLIVQGVYSVAYGPLGHGSDLLIELPDVKTIANEIGRTPAQV